MTFPSDILGVIVRDGQLNASRPLLGAPTTMYPAGGAQLELSNGDTVSLSADRRIVTFSFAADVGIDAVRIVTRSITE